MKRWTLFNVVLGIMACATSVTAGQSGVGLDYRSWNGALLQGPGGGLFGVRVGLVRGGKLITGSAFYDQVERVGDYDPEGSYAAVMAGGMKLEWRMEGADLYGMVTATTNVQIVIECYAAHDYSGAVIPINAYIPFRNPATFALSGPRRIEGRSPRQKIRAGQTLVTGGHARVTGRELQLDPGVQPWDYFGLEADRDAVGAYSGEAVNNTNGLVCPPDGVAKTGPADREEGGFWVKSEAITYLLFNLEPGRPVGFKATTGTKPLIPVGQVVACDIPAVIREGRRLFDTRKIEGTGELAGWARPMLNEISWMRMFHPFERKIVIPAGRRWMMDGRYNCWGWDENFNAMVVAVEDQVVAENNLGWALGCERIGPLAAWSVYCRRPNPELLRSVYPVYRKLYPPGDAGLVDGQPGWKSGPCWNGNVGKGMDDTPMREHGRKLGMLYSLDMSCMKAWGIEILSRMAEELGLQEDAVQYRKDLGEMRKKINHTFWMESEGMYRNRYASGEWSLTESPTSFYPWLAGCPDEKQTAAMLRNLEDPKKFGGEFVIPTLSRMDPEYGKPSFELHDGKQFPPYTYWRGAIWPPPNFLVYEGLKRYRLDEAAAELARKSVRIWAKTWDDKGWACENYNPETGARTEMAHSHQSWAMLLPLMGVKELIDVEWWNDPVTLRFGTLCHGEHAIRRIPLRGRLYDVTQNDNNLELRIDGKLRLKIEGGRVVVRNFVLNENRIRCDVTSKQQVSVTLLDGQGVAKPQVLPSGTHSVGE